MPSTTFTVRVEPDVKKRLEKLAKSTGRTRSFLAAEALNDYLDANEWQVAGVKRAIVSLERGEGVSHKELRNGSIPGTNSMSGRFPSDWRDEKSSGRRKRFKT